MDVYSHSEQGQWEKGLQAVIETGVIRVETNLGVFGNRTDLFLVDAGVVRGASLLECSNPNVEYSDSLEHRTERDTMLHLDRSKDDDLKASGPLDDGT